MLIRPILKNRVKVITVPGADHFSVRNAGMRRQMQREIDAIIKSVQ